MTIDDSRFASLAAETLERFADAIDDAVGDVVDADLQGGILTLALDGGGQYVLNKNAPMKQLWLASPVSGAWHFDWSGQGWVSTREPKIDLAALLSEELKARTGVAVEL